MKHLRPQLIAPLIILTAVVWMFREPLQRQIREHGILKNDAPTTEVVSEMIDRAKDPQAALLALWNSGGIIHREVAVEKVRQLFPTRHPLPREVESLLLSAAFDPDLNVREIAFGILHERHHPALFALAAAQLRDADQAVRWLGLEQFKDAPAAVGVPLAASLLNDPDPAVAGLSVKFIEDWSGQKFGVKLQDTVQVENATNGLLGFSDAGAARTETAVKKAAAWWAEHQGEFQPVALQTPAEMHIAQTPLPAGDFQLRGLDGKDIRLSDFHGKVVLINFWTTWCTACVGEIPELIALQKAHGDDLTIIGVALDGIPDEDGDTGGHQPETQEQLRAKVARTAASRGINYPVLLDSKYSVGGRFNGGELPTTVIVDANGNIRRRFIGARSLPVFEAMIKDALKNPSTNSQPTAVQTGRINKT